MKNEKNDTLLDVVTYLSGSERDRQTVDADGGTLRDNDFIDFDLPENATLAVAAGTLLAGGTDGEVQTTSYTDYFDAVDEASWSTMAIPGKDALVKAAAYSYIKTRRDQSGRKCQAVLVDYPAADHEGIISVDQGYWNLASEEITPAIFAATVAGMTAAAQINQSNTFLQLGNAVKIINPLKDQVVEDALKAGRFVLTRRQDGGIVVEQDINSFHSFLPTKGYEFSKNRVIRVLDDIGNQIKSRFENAYVGKVDNNAIGRSVFRADIISYLSELQGLGAIQNLNPDKDVTVAQGMSIDALVANVYVQPVDAMEKLYLQVYVSATDTAQAGRGV